MGKTGRKNRNYSAEFKIHVIMDMREHHLSYNETVRKYALGNTQAGGARLMVQRWERIFLEEGAEGLMKERRGRACSAGGTRKGRPPKLDKKVEEDLIAEMFYGETFESINAFIAELKRYIHYYNNERFSLKLKGMSPVQYRTHSHSI